MQSVDTEPAKRSSDKAKGCPNLQRLQQNCPDFQAIYKYKTTGEVPEDDKQARTLVAEASQFEIQTGLLYHFLHTQIKRSTKRRKVGKTISCTKDHA